ncbi:MAG: glycosyltransferase [Crocinitomicaceae bacterium]|nr:glycosyltransferase [Crocinitomicaceae bacterium]
MNIGINARHLIKGKLEGIGWYSFEILNRLVLLMPKHNFFFFYDRKTDFLISGENVFNLILKPSARHPILFRIWFNYVLPKKFKKFKIDLFFSPDGFISLNTLIPQIGVIHDLNFEHYPEDLPKNVLKYYQKYMPLFSRKAEKIITVSNFSKTDIVENYRISPKKITVIYNGGNDAFRTLNTNQKKVFIEENNNNRPFFIYVGSLHKRKNIERMLRGFKKFNFLNKMDFIIIGTDMWKNQLNLDGLLDNVRFLGRKSGPELVNWVASSSALIYVSYFEGFGLPVLEGMLSGVPVVTSNLTSIPEVGGNSVIYVDPFNEDSISKGMEKSLENNQELIKKGFIQAEKFSWDISALKVKELLLNYNS